MINPCWTSYHHLARHLSPSPRCVMINTKRQIARIKSLIATDNMIKTFAVRTIKRTDADTTKALGRAGVLTVHEAQGRIGLVKPYKHPIYAGARVSGTAITVLAQPGDNWMLHVAIELCQPGDMLIVACTTDNGEGFFGDRLATSARARGVVGLVIDGGTRDVADIQQMGFPVWSRAISSKGTVKNTPGAVNVPIICAGQVIFPGDVIIADDDGIFVVAQKDARAARQAADERIANEDAKRVKLAAGELGINIYNMRPALAEAGFHYVETLDELGEFKGIDCRNRD
jgi:4-hydroxy-4-methyl-2-oxoglutarate aldolase